MRALRMRLIGIGLAATLAVNFAIVAQSYAQGAPGGGRGMPSGMGPSGGAMSGSSFGGPRYGGSPAAQDYSDSSASPQLIAQSSSSDQDRLGVVERELNQLQRQVYRNEVGGAAELAPSGGEPSSSSAPTLDVQLRMDRLEADIRALRGQVDESHYGITQINSRLDKLQSDNELRFQQLENGQGGGSPPQSAAAAKPEKGAGEQGVPASASGVLSPPDNAATAAAPPAAATTTLPAGSAADQYKYAFGLLGSRDYKGAEGAFKAFLLKHPNDALAPNARYWLGETYFGREDYATAAASFADAYQKDPQGVKAPEDLLKLGMSLGKQGRKPDACASFSRLEKSFPTMAPSMKDRVSREKQRLSC